MDRTSLSDRVDVATRSRIMTRIRSSNTGLELRFRRYLWAAGLRGYRCHRRDILGVPDLSWPKLRVAVFVDSSWWHGHPSRWKPGRLPGNWDAKIRGNRARDASVTEQLAKEGWRVLRVWDFEVERDPAEAVKRVAGAVRAARAAVPWKP
jgi:DNA mismatch endonuclease (patch repair protein)